MAQQSNEKLVEQMRKAQTEEVYEGVRVLVKPIPEGGNDGDMDPRLYKSMKNLALIMRFMPKSKKKKSVLERVMPLRKMFNTYKGKILVKEGVKTDFVKVASADGYPVPVRVYTREQDTQNRPIFVYYHGGGFFGGSPDIVEQMCMLLVQKLDCVAINVDYRICPECCYPAPLDDCFYATKWAYDNAHKYGGDPSRLSVSGDSAGGNLAAAVTLRDREEKTGLVKMTALLYPAVNIAGKYTEFYKGVEMSKYHQSAAHKKVLTATLNMMTSILGSDPGGNFLEDVYLQGKLQTDNIYASPLLDPMQDLPPVLLIFGEHDFLVFEDFAYAQTATKANVKIKTIVYRGLGHGFADQIGVVPQAEDVIAEIAAYIEEIMPQHIGEMTK